MIVVKISSHRLIVFALLSAVLMPVAALAAAAPGVECVSFERSMQGSVLEIRCLLEIENLGDTAFSAVSAEVADPDGAELDASARFRFGDLAPRGTARADQVLIFSFDVHQQEPPRIELEIRFEDESKSSVQSARVRL